MEQLQQQDSDKEMFIKRAGAWYRHYGVANQESITRFLGVTLDDFYRLQDTIRRRKK